MEVSPNTEMQPRPNLPMKDHELRAIHRALVDWFGANARPLPWREAYHPYQVWISEVMLQQTRVETMLPYFQRWMKRFPDIETLAAAPLDDVLKAWEGLGYYARARSLHRAAKAILLQYGGQLPDQVEPLRQLPGIGPYTAGAIASIAFQIGAPAVDGNGTRVISRLLASEVPPASPEGKKRLWDTAARLVEYGQPRAFNQALMELGALICLARSPGCANCPVQPHCRAASSGDPQAYPVSTRKPAQRKTRIVLLLLVMGDRVLLGQRPSQGLWGGLWEPPWVESEESVRDQTQGASLLENLGLKPPRQNGSGFRVVGGFSHDLTHIRFEVNCLQLRLPDQGGPLPSHPAWVDWQWADADQTTHRALSKLAQKSLCLL